MRNGPRENLAPVIRPFLTAVRKRREPRSGTKQESRSGCGPSRTSDEIAAAHLFLLMILTEDKSGFVHCRSPSSNPQHRHNKQCLPVSYGPGVVNN